MFILRVISAVEDKVVKLRPSRALFYSFRRVATAPTLFRLHCFAGQPPRSGGPTKCSNGCSRRRTGRGDGYDAAPLFPIGAPWGIGRGRLIRCNRHERGVPGASAPVPVVRIVVVVVPVLLLRKRANGNVLGLIVVPRILCALSPPLHVVAALLPMMVSNVGTWASTLVAANPSAQVCADHRYAHAHVEAHVAARRHLASHARIDALIRVSN